MREPAAAAPQPDALAEIGRRLLASVQPILDWASQPDTHALILAYMAARRPDAEARLPGRAGETTTEAEALSAMDKLALTMAKDLIMRGDNPPINMTCTIIAALERIVDAAEHIAGLAAAHERAGIRQQLMDIVLGNVAEHGPEVVYYLLLEAIRLLGEDGDKP